MTDDATTGSEHEGPTPLARSSHQPIEMSTDADRGTERLRGEIQSRLDGLSAKQRRLARFLLENEEQLPFTTAGGVGSAVGASAATVVRFAQLLGYSGFAELRDSLRNGTPRFPTFLQQLSGLADLQASSPSDLMRLVFRYEQENLIGTARSMDPAALEGAAAAISRANRVILAGAGVGRSVVQLLGGHLARLKSPVVMPADTIDTVIALANAGADDVVLGVSFWRFAKSTSDWLQLGRQRGATTIAIVDSPLYPTAGAVDHLLVVRSTNPGHGPSTVAAAAVVNMLISAVILTDFDRFFDAIEHLDGAYAEAHVYLE